jgi:hypothetical protein
LQNEIKVEGANHQWRKNIVTLLKRSRFACLHDLQQSRVKLVDRFRDF